MYAVHILLPQMFFSQLKNLINFYMEDTKLYNYLMLNTSLHNTISDKLWVFKEG